MVLLKHFLPTPRTGLGRNERCWCGSGRSTRSAISIAKSCRWRIGRRGCIRSRLPISPTARSFRCSWRPPPKERGTGTSLMRSSMRSMRDWSAMRCFSGRRVRGLPRQAGIPAARGRAVAGRTVASRRAVGARGSCGPARGGMTLRDVRTGDVNEVRERPAALRSRAANCIVPASFRPAKPCRSSAGCTRCRSAPNETG